MSLAGFRAGVKAMLTISIRRSALAAALALSIAPAAGAADPAPASACPTWFPDFSCDRAQRFDGFVMPGTSPFLFEEPFNTTGLYLWGVWHQFPDSSAFQGGDAGVVALAARVAITERLSFIATKDGFMWASPDNPILPHTSGLMDVAGGFKYAAVVMPEYQFILSPILRFQFPIGTRRVYQGNGSVAALPSLSVGKGFGDFHLLGDIGVFIPFNNSNASSMIWYNVHADYRVLPWLTPFVELNGYSYVHDGNGNLPVRVNQATAGALGVDRVDLNAAQGLLGTGGFEGLDVTNLGSRNVASSTVITGAIGVRIPLPGNISLSAAWEGPMTTTRYIERQRVTTNLSYEF